MNDKACHGRTSVIVASEHGQLQVVRDLLKHESVDMNAKDDDDGLTALYFASFKGYFKVVRELLKHETVEVNARNDDGRTALITASDEGHSKVVR